MIIVGWMFFTTAGFLMQLYGLLLLFKSFIRTIFSYVQTLPVIGPIVRNSPIVHKIVDYIADGNVHGKAGGKGKGKPVQGGEEDAYQV